MHTANRTNRIILTGYTGLKHHSNLYRINGIFKENFESVHVDYLMISYKEYKTSFLDKKMMRKILIEKQLV